jgi:hypothetical protein
MLLFSPEGLGCFIPAVERDDTFNVGALRRTLRKEAMDLAQTAMPLVTCKVPTKGPDFDGDLHLLWLDVESEEADQICVKRGLSVVLEPSVLYADLLRRAARRKATRMSSEEVRRIRELHERRRACFMKNLETFRCTHICTQTALTNFARHGRFDTLPSKDKSVVEPRYRPEQRAQILRGVANLLQNPKFELILVEDDLPIGARVLAKQGRSPVVCMEVLRTGSRRQWAKISEPTFCKELSTHLSKTADSPPNSMEWTQKECLRLAGEAALATD